MAMKSKIKSDKGASFASGGSTKMFGPQGADPAKPGTSSVNAAGMDKKFGIPPNTGKGRMFGQQGADPAMPGTSSPNSGMKDNKFKVEGGKTKMFGKQSATLARAGTSSPSNG